MYQLDKSCHNTGNSFFEHLESKLVTSQKSTGPGWSYAQKVAKCNTAELVAQPFDALPETVSNVQLAQFLQNG